MSYQVKRESRRKLNNYSGPGEVLNAIYVHGLSAVIGNLKTRGYSERALSAVKSHYELVFDLLPLEDIWAYEEYVDPACYDVLGRMHEEYLHQNSVRHGTGEYYSPPEVVGYMIDSLGIEDDPELPDRMFIDIACGTGVFLVTAMKKAIASMRETGVPEQDIFRFAICNFYGLDINPISCVITEINVYLVLLDEFGPAALTEAGNIDFNIFETDAIENRAYVGDKAHSIKHREGRYAGGFHYVIGNPPYLEAKKLPPAAKEVCRANYPDAIGGAFDLYVAFIAQCNRLVSDRGKIFLILPNKFTVAGYARKIREQILSDYSIKEIVDLSETDVFNRAMVYPVLFHYEKTPPGTDHRISTRMSVISLEDLRAGKHVLIPASLYRVTGKKATFFCIPEEGEFVSTFTRLFDTSIQISDFIAFRSTVSFHKKGLREQFVSKNFAGAEVDRSVVKKYLGGLSYAKKNEVECYGFSWEGYYINYDRYALLKLDNNLPPLDNFLREKIVLCQHARRITAAFDSKGDYVTKDVYPIGIAKPRLSGSGMSLKYFTGLLNSELMSFIYGIVFKGVQVGSGYYHYLPTWLDILPVIAPDKEDVLRIEAIVDEISVSGSSDRKRELIAEIDSIVYRVYGITVDQQRIIKNTVPTIL